MCGFRACIRDPDEVPQVLADVAGDFSLRATRPGAFCARLRGARMGGVGVFEVLGITFFVLLILELTGVINIFSTF